MDVTGADYDFCVVPGPRRNDVAVDGELSDAIGLRHAGKIAQLPSRLPGPGESDIALSPTRPKGVVRRRCSFVGCIWPVAPPEYS